MKNQNEVIVEQEVRVYQIKDGDMFSATGQPIPAGKYTFMRQLVLVPCEEVI